MVITSTANPLIKRIRRLKARKHRDADGAFFVEGIRPVWSALDSGWEVEELVVAPDLLTSAEAGAMLDRHRRVPRTEVAAEVFESLAEREHPSGLGAIVRARTTDLDALPIDADSVFLVVDEAGNPGNLGTILRTTDAAGARGVILVGTGTDPFHPTAVKASMGTLFAIPVAKAGSLAEVERWAKAHGVATVATSARAERDYTRAEYPLPAVILLGSEAIGLPPATIAAADLAVRIPMAGTASSLNVAVAAGIILFEIMRRTDRR